MIERESTESFEGEAAEPGEGDAFAAEAPTSDAPPEASAPETEEPEPDEPANADRSLVVVPARNALRRIRSGMTTASGATVDRVGQAMEGMERSWSERPGSRVRRVRRMASEPLAYLANVHPEARSARPVDVGLETVDVADIAGTNVGGGDQRGGDFLPLKPFRGANWRVRWQRLRQAHDRLAMLPPIDVVKYADKYWVVDGHNRVALALYTGQVGIDANVVELVRPGERRTEPILPLGPTVAASQGVRTAGQGQRPSHVLAREDSVPIDRPDVAE
jgi:hypothetical protein